MSYWVIKNEEDEYYYAMNLDSKYLDSEDGWWWITSQKEATVFETRSTAHLVAETLTLRDARVVKLVPKDLDPDFTGRRA